MKTKPPIVVVAFGTTTRALETYDFIDDIISSDHPGHGIHWAYSSRMVRDWIKKKRNVDLKHPHEVLSELAEEGHAWAVVQSLHLLAGHEFYRLVEEVSQLPIRVAMGLPLLSDPTDHRDLVAALGPSLPNGNKTADVLVGHGTDHPVWATYPALQKIFQDEGYPQVHVGVVEQGYPERSQILEAMGRYGYTHVHLVPLMMVAGVHFSKDLVKGQNAWRPAFEEAGFSVSVQSHGLGFNRDVIEIYSKHIRNALDLLPR